MVYWRWGTPEQPASKRSKTTLNALIMFAPWEVAKDPKSSRSHMRLYGTASSSAFGFRSRKLLRAQLVCRIAGQAADCQLDECAGASRRTPASVIDKQAALVGDVRGKERDQASGPDMCRCRHSRQLPNRLAGEHRLGLDLLDIGAQRRHHFVPDHPIAYLDVPRQDLPGARMTEDAAAVRCQSIQMVRGAIA
jgi:hypothetical protein